MTVAGAFRTGSWLAGFSQLLDEHHLVVLSEDPEARDRFGHALGLHLGTFPGSQVLHIPGQTTRNLAAFAQTLSDGLHLAQDLPPRVSALVKALRHGPDGLRRRYLIWNHAEEMLEADVRLFSRLAQALMAVAVEHEYLNPDPLILQRVIFIGGHKLGAYAEEEYGQFCTWSEDHEQDEFDEAFDCVRFPQVLTYRLDG